MARRTGTGGTSRSLTLVLLAATLLVVATVPARAEPPLTLDPGPITDRVGAIPDPSGPLQRQVEHEK
jgi:hypothetical protein